MKIIHTADWHIGKVLHKQELNGEAELFLEWLNEFITREEIDALLVSGDIFDLANPAHKDLSLYYQFLHNVSRTGIQVVITGGNHDSVSLLQTTQSLLKPMQIHVVAGMPEDVKNVVIPLCRKNGKPGCIALAIPYLRDKDLRTAESADNQQDKWLNYAAAIRNHYSAALRKAQEEYGNEIPVIAMGHLFVQGALTSDSEREIHVGTLQGVDGSHFPGEIGYFALGHIHKPQRIGKNDAMRYSGSPYYLDFSEVGFEKQILVIECHEGKALQVQSVPVPCFRKLLRWQGRLAEIRNQISTFANDAPLQAFAEVHVTEKKFDAQVIAEMDDMANQKNECVKIIKSRIEFLEKSTEDEDWAPDIQIRELTPTQVLDRKLDAVGIPDDERIELLEVYASVLEEVYQQSEV
jgi:exonuclease SbcD